MFPARLAALRRLMPDPRFTPARLAPGLGAVGLLCFKYRDSDIGPYSEVSISVALNDPWFDRAPLGSSSATAARSPANSRGCSSHTSHCNTSPCPRFEAILHGPDHLNLPLIRRLATQQATATHLHHR